VLEIALHTRPEVPLEAESLAPQRLLGLAVAEIEKLPALHGNERCVLADFFRVQGSAEGEIVLSGDLDRIKLIGAGMTGGRMVIHGRVGAHLGAGMRGGEIVVHGDAADWIAPEMSGGRILVLGNAGHMAGSAHRGSMTGITGGEIIIRGNAGNEVGAGMRRGLIAIGGDAGDFTGVNMLAGTIIVFGQLGPRAGAGMKRGSIVAMRDTELLPTFSYACTYHPDFLRVYLLHLRSLGVAVSDESMEGPYRRWSGDSLEMNRGEVLLLANGAGERAASGARP
jgi:formylmethanofuran dehydrogenase subunit C